MARPRPISRRRREEPWTRPHQGDGGRNGLSEIHRW